MLRRRHMPPWPTLLQRRRTGPGALGPELYERRERDLPGRLPRVPLTPAPLRRTSRVPEAVQRLDVLGDAVEPEVPVCFAIRD